MRTEGVSNLLTRSAEVWPEFYPTARHQSVDTSAYSAVGALDPEVPERAKPRRLNNLPARPRKDYESESPRLESSWANHVLNR